MSEEETIKQNNEVLQAILELSKRFDGIDKRLDGHDAQFEAIRQGLVANNVAFDRLQSTVLNIRADLNELKEEIRHKRIERKELV